MSTVGYRGPDYPIAIGANATGIAGSATFIKRVQDFSIDEQAPQQPLYEMGNTESCGLFSDNKQFSGSVTWYPIDMAFERAIGGTTGDVLLANLVDASQVRLVGKDVQLLGAALERLQYDLAVRQPSQASAQFRGIGRTGIGTITVTVPNPSLSDTIFSPDEINVYVGTSGTGASWATGTVAKRAQRVQVVAAINREEGNELGTSNPVGVDGDNPQVTATVDYIAGTAAAGDAYIPAASPQDMEVRFGADFKIRLYNMVTTRFGHRGSVRGYATRQIAYMSAGDALTGGMRVTTTMTA